MPLFSFAEPTYVRALTGAYVPSPPAAFPQPRVVRANRSLARELGIDTQALKSDEAARLLTGHGRSGGDVPVAMAYAGHQFGGFAPSLGDGRAVLLGEVIDRSGRRVDVHLKGSGPTPFARGGDGKATLAPMLRELLMGEAMHGLGIPTTRALAVVSTGETVVRERLLPGAMLVRVASSHLRIGTFEYFAAREQLGMLQRLVAFALERHGPWPVDPAQRGRALLEVVIARQAVLIAHWMSVGFIHGVMNTDNMAVSGETIDYGPCAFMDRYDPGTVYSSIDRHGRYAFGNQPKVALWNLSRFAEALLPTLAPDPELATTMAVEALGAFAPAYERAWRGRMGAKLGLGTVTGDDDALIVDFLALLHEHNVDYTSGFRSLLAAATGECAGLDALAPAGAFTRWRTRWLSRVGADASSAVLRMRAANPMVVARNHRVEDALTAAVDGNLAPFDALMELLPSPFEDANVGELLEPPSLERQRSHRTFCGT